MGKRLAPPINYGGTTYVSPYQFAGREYAVGDLYFTSTSVYDAGTGRTFSALGVPAGRAAYAPDPFGPAKLPPVSLEREANFADWIDNPELAWDQFVVRNWQEHVEPNLDRIQTAISVMGMLPGVGIFADGLNSLIYLGRGQYDEAAMSLVSAIPIAGDLAGAANLARKAGQLALRSAAQNLAGQSIGLALNSEREFSLGQALGAGLTAGLASTASVKLGRVLGASEAGLTARMGALATGSAASSALGSAARQYLDNGTVDLGQVGLDAAFGALGAALGQAAFDKTCFRTGTPMQWEHGYKKVEELRQGERLTARNEFDPEGPIEWKAIEEVFERRGLILEVTVGGQVIGTTAEHPFYLHGKGWTPAGERGAHLAGIRGRPVRWTPTFGQTMGLDKV